MICALPIQVAVSTFISTMESRIVIPCFLFAFQIILGKLINMLSSGVLDRCKVPQSSEQSLGIDPLPSIENIGGTAQLSPSQPHSLN